MPTRRLQSIPAPHHVESNVVRKILVPIIDVIERRFLRVTNERAVTRQDLVQLGLATQEQINELPEE